MLNKRNEIVDELKGFAIILVVIGHVIVDVYDPVAYSNNCLFKFCYSFHMALFTFLSSYLLGSKGADYFNKQWLKKRFLRLIIPFIIWAFINSVYHIIVEGLSITSLPGLYLTKLFVSPVPWFLLNLFMCDIGLYLSHIKRLTKPFIVQCTYYIICSGIFAVTKIEIFKNVLLFFPYYLLGIYSYNLKERNKEWFNRMCTIGAVLYIPSMFLYTYGIVDASERAKHIVAMFENQQIESVIKYGLIFYSRYVVGILGIMFAYLIVRSVHKTSFLRRLAKVLNYYGQRTIYIYLMASMFSIHAFNSIELNTLISLVLGLTIPLLICEVLKNYPKINKILFG